MDTNRHICSHVFKDNKNLEILEQTVGELINLVMSKVMSKPKIS